MGACCAAQTSTSQLPRVSVAARPVLAGPLDEEPELKDKATPPAALCLAAPSADPPELDVRARGNSFVDAEGRTLTLRGFNVSGNSKLPSRPSESASHCADGFFESAATCSFVGRPFPIDEADVHFNRLRAYGCNVVRLLVTWEAIEHAGPGHYDDEYIEYIAQIVERAEAFGMSVYIDPHQDVWSRFSGGDGAPAWTFEVAGLDVRSFDETGAALRHQTFKGNKAAFPRMCWPTNLHKLACGTMFTLFWGGRSLAPEARVGGENLQSYLQRHYIAAMARLAAALRPFPNVIGFGTLNEPLPGFIGIKRLDQLSGPLKNDAMPTPFQAMALGSGFEVEVGIYAVDLVSAARGKPSSKRRMNSSRTSAWLPGRTCVWKDHGVWGLNDRGQPELLRPDYFASVDFGELYVAFAKAYMAAVREAGNPRWFCFVELPPADLGLCEFPHIARTELPGVINSPHWYDQLTLFLGRHVPWAAINVQTGTPALGRSAVRRLHVEQIAELSRLGTSHLDGVPTLIGETGIPFDLHGRELYEKGQMKNVVNALAGTVDALEANLSSYTLWCYAPDHQPAWGDMWNLEDLSVYSAAAPREVPREEDPSGVYEGGRALRAFVRPYAMAVAGEIERSSFKSNGTFVLAFRSATGITAPPTVIFVPVAVQYPEGYTIEVSDGTCTIGCMPASAGGFHRIEYKHSPDVEFHCLKIFASDGGAPCILPAVLPHWPMAEAQQQPAKQNKSQDLTTSSKGSVSTSGEGLSKVAPSSGFETPSVEDGGRRMALGEASSHPHAQDYAFDGTTNGGHPLGGSQ